MQVDGGEQGQLASARFNLGLRPIQILLDFGLQRLQDGQILGVHAVLAQLLDVAGDEFVILVVLLIKGLFAPVEDGFELVQGSDAFNNLVIGVAVVANASGGIRIGGIPYQIGHDALILTAGDQRVAADLGVLFDHQHGVAVLGSLRGRSDASAAGADDDHVIGFLDGILSFVNDLVGLEGIQVGAASLLSRIVYRAADGRAGEGSAGNGVHARAVGSQDIGDHGLKGHIAHILGFLVRAHLDGGNGGIGEGDAHFNAAVVAAANARVGAGSEGQRRGVLGGFALGLRQSLAQRFLDGVAGDGRAGDGIHRVRVAYTHQGRSIFFNRRAAQSGGFLFAGNFYRGYSVFINGNLYGHVAAEAGRGARILARREGGRVARKGHDGHHHHQQKRHKLLHRVFLLYMVFFEAAFVLPHKI